jgi:hypothetical protein
VELPPEQVTLTQIWALLAQEGLLVLSAFLAIVFFIPVTIPGIGTLFGAAVLLIGLSRICHHKLRLPKRLLDRRFPTEKLRTALYKGMAWFNRLEHVNM